MKASHSNIFNARVRVTLILALAAFPSAHADDANPAAPCASPVRIQHSIFAGTTLVRYETVTCAAASRKGNAAPDPVRKDTKSSPPAAVTDEQRKPPRQ